MTGGEKDFPMKECYICIDLGTSRIKCSLINKDGNFIYYSKRDASTYYREIIYQDPDEYLRIVFEEINKMKNRHPDHFSRIHSLMISGQMGGVLGIDKDFNIVFPWSYSVDTKYNEYLSMLEDNYRKEIRESSGGIATMAAKIIWIKERFPDKYIRVEKFINLMSYVASRLCGLSCKEAFIDCSCLTMTGIADIKALSWNKELCKEFKIDISKLPAIKRATDRIGVIKSSVFETIKDVEVIAGCGDQVAGFIGAGINKRNDLIDVSGTYTILGYCGNTYISDTEYESLHSIYSGISDIYYQIAIIAAGGYTLDWFLKNFNYISKRDSLLKKTINDKEKLYFIPHFGGRYSPSQPHFRGGWIGAKWEHDINDFYKSILESSGYELYNAFNTIKKVNKLDDDRFSSIKVIGGGSLNDYENEIKASILDLDYVRLNNLPFELIGGFLISKFGNEIKKGYESLLSSQIIRVEKEYKPKELMKKYYENPKNKYLKIINKLEEIYSEINSN